MSVIEDLGLKGYSDAISKTRDKSEDQLGNVMELVRAAESYKDDGSCIPPALEDESMETQLGNFLDDDALKLILRLKNLIMKVAVGLKQIC